METNESLLNNELHIDDTTQSYLSETAKWANFLGIMGIVFSGILVLVTIFAKYTGVTNSFSDSDFPTDEIIFRTFIFLAAVVNFFMALFLYRFAQKMKVALTSNDQLTLNESFLNLKKLYRLGGILTIIYLSVLVLLIIVGVIVMISNR
jgi:hypothetical protein